MRGWRRQAKLQHKLQNPILINYQNYLQFLGRLAFMIDADNQARLLYVPPHKRAQFKYTCYVGSIQIL